MPHRTVMVPGYGTAEGSNALRCEAADAVDAGYAWFKMKIGRDADVDARRVDAVCESVGTPGRVIDLNRKGLLPYEGIQHAVGPTGVISWLFKHHQLTLRVPFLH